jgi:hypothetical protein
VTSEADQQRLHAWPDWDESVHLGRKLLDYDTAWTARPGEVPGPEYRAWRERVELRRFLFEARRALITLRLPDNFSEYWLACFLAPYEQDGLESILDPQPDGTVHERRVFPPPSDLWFEAGVDYSTAPYKLVIEGPAALASSTLLRAAVRRALAAKHREGFSAQHPFVHSRQIGPVLDERAATRARPNPARTGAMRRARAWSEAGEKPEFIAFRLGQRGYRVSERQVRRWLIERPTDKSDTPSCHDDGPMAKT